MAKLMTTIYIYMIKANPDYNWY